MDICAGSGTTAVTSQFLGLKPVAIEVNPFLADLIQAKLTEYDPDDVRIGRGVLRRALARQPFADPALLTRRLPTTFIEPGFKSRWLFPQSTASRILAYVDAIDSMSDERIQRLFRVLIGSILVPSSNALINGKGRRYKASWMSRQCTPDDVDRLFIDAYEAAFADIARFKSRRPDTSFEVYRGDSRTVLKSLRTKVDLVLFSPPYPNSFDYTDIYNIELWMLGYLKSVEDNLALRNSTLRSHVQIHRDFSFEELDSRPLHLTVRKLRRIRADLWDSTIPEMVGAYFSDMSLLLRQLKRLLSRQGQISVVVGDSRYNGIKIDVPEILVDIAIQLGLRLTFRKQIRNMRSSAQQGGDFHLAESLLRFAHA
jgi:DNA modification methylase